MTAAALAVAASWNPGSDRYKLLLEADGSGGCLALRYNLPTEPGLVTLASASRAGMAPSDLWDHTKQLPGGLRVVLAPDGADQVEAALGAAGAALGRLMNTRPDLDVIADLGRLGPRSAATALAAEAAAVLMVARPRAEQLQPLARRMQALQPYAAHLGWVLIGDQPHGPSDVEDTFGWPVVGVLADDDRSVQAIERGEVGRRLRRQPFVRSAATLADTLATWLASSTVKRNPGPPDGQERVTPGPDTEERWR